MQFAVLAIGAMAPPRWAPTSSVAPEDLTAGCVVVPTLARRWDSPGDWARRRSEMCACGLYPGVDYVVVEELGDQLAVRPAYPLVGRLERRWPVVVDRNVAPRWMYPSAYNAMTACFAVGLNVVGLAFAFAMSLALTLSVVPSASMEPAIRPNDVLIVEKISPRLGIQPPRGSLVFFRPPPALQDIVKGVSERARAEGGGGSAAETAVGSGRALYVKRVAGVPSDSVDLGSDDGSVRVNGQNVGTAIGPRSRLAPLAWEGGGVGPLKVPARSYFVLGDNSGVSVDSRCWGFLPQGDVAGRPILRVLPLDRFGMIDAPLMTVRGQSSATSAPLPEFSAPLPQSEILSERVLSATRDRLFQPNR